MGMANLALGDSMKDFFAEAWSGMRWGSWRLEKTPDLPVSSCFLFPPTIHDPRKHHFGCLPGASADIQGQHVTSTKLQAHHERRKCRSWSCTGTTVFFLGFLSFKNPDGLETLPKKYVHSPDVQSGEDTLVASLGADEMRAMHLTDASRLSLAAGIWVLGSWTLSISSVLPYIIFNDEGARHREDIWQIRLGVSSRCSLYDVVAVEPSHIRGINDHLARMLSYTIVCKQSAERMSSILILLQYMCISWTHSTYISDESCK